MSEFEGNDFPKESWAVAAHSGTKEYAISRSPRVDGGSQCDNSNLDDAPSHHSLFLEHQMQAWLLLLSFPAYAALIRLLLLRCGYTTVRALDQSPASSRSGRRCTGEGGFDLLALCHTDMATFLSAVSLKTGRVPISRRVVDELRGAMARVGAEQGLLFATSFVSAKTRAVASAPGLPPVHLFDGKALARLLIERRIGLRQTGEEWVFDAGFFESLETRANQPVGAKESSDTRGQTS